MRGKELPQAAAAAATSPVPANKSFRTDRGPEAGGRGMPSPFINLDERGRHTPPPSFLPLVPMRKGLLEEVLPLPPQRPPPRSWHAACLLSSYEVDTVKISSLDHWSGLRIGPRR